MPAWKLAVHGRSGRSILVELRRVFPRDEGAQTRIHAKPAPEVADGAVVDDVAFVAVEQAWVGDAFGRPDGDMALTNAQDGAGDDLTVNGIAIAQQNRVAFA